MFVYESYSLVTNESGLGGILLYFKSFLFIFSHCKGVVDVSNTFEMANVVSISPIGVSQTPLL